MSKTKTMKAVLRSRTVKAVVAAFLVLLVLAYINARPKLPPLPGPDFDENAADSRPLERRQPDLWTADNLSSKGPIPANPNATFPPRTFAPGQI